MGPGRNMGILRYIWAAVLHFNLRPQACDNLEDLYEKGNPLSLGDSQAHTPRMEQPHISDFARVQSMRSNETRIPRKPVPRRLNSRQSSTRRPSSARSFAQAFSWLTAVLPERQPPLQEQEIAEENISPILPQANRKSWRFTSRFDPRMDSGLTLFDPDLQATPKRQMSDASSVVRDLNVEWHLPPLRFSFTDTSNQSIINAAIDAPANLPPEKSGDTPPPNGGTLAWLQVLGAFFLYFNSWGTLNTFGVFQTYYVDTGILHKSPSDISWIGSAQAFLAMMVGVVTGPLYDAGYFRHLILAGGIMVSLGFMMTSLCTTYWQTLLAQGICIGIGNGCLFVPSVAILPQYFTTKNALVNGIAASGSSIGGIIMPFVFVRLQAHIGFPWATRVLGFLTVATISISMSVMKPRLMPASKRKLVDLSAFREPEYCFFVCAVFFGFIGFLVPLFYLGLYASSTGATSASFAFYLLPILNASSTFGRIAPNFLAGYTGPLNVYIPVALVAGILIFAWCGITNFAGMIVFAVLYGFFSGGFVGLMPVSLVTLTPDLRKLGTRTGQAFFIASFGVLMGSPVAGAILNKTGSWVAMKCFAGTAVCMAMVFLLAARVRKVGWSLKVKT